MTAQVLSLHPMIFIGSQQGFAPIREIQWDWAVIAYIRRPATPTIIAGVSRARVDMVLCVFTRLGKLDGDHFNTGLTRREMG